MAVTLQLENSDYLRKLSKSEVKGYIATLKLERKFAKKWIKGAKRELKRRK